MYRKIYCLFININRGKNEWNEQWETIAELPNNNRKKGKVSKFLSCVKM